MRNPFIKISCFLVLFVFLTPLVSQADPLTAPTYKNNSIIAMVGGEPVWLDDLKNPSIHEAMVRLYEMQKSLLKQKIFQMLAKKHPDLIAEKLPEVTKKHLIQFYKTTPGINEMGSFEQMEEDIRTYLEKIQKESYFERIYNKALEKGWVVDFLKAPNDFRLVAQVGSAMPWFKENGESSRQVYVLEFSDFQCPFCKRVQSTLTKLRKRYSNEVQFVYRHFPLPFHEKAKTLAEAVECARDQGRFWEMQSLFYKAEPPELEGDFILSYAKQAGVKNLKIFKTCLDEGKHQKRVSQDIQEGLKIGIQGTPTFVIGLHDPQSSTVTGEMFSGAVPEEKFVTTIEKFITLKEAKLKKANLKKAGP
ncbi:MAG: DsbA family protein [Nitrospinales bacterium]